MVDFVAAARRSVNIIVQNSIQHEREVIVADAQRLRWQIFVEEKRYLHVHVPLDRERDWFDALWTTIHFVAYLAHPSGAWVPAGTSRLVVWNDRVAPEIPMAERYDVSAVLLERGRESVAEVSRFCVAPLYRGTRVTVMLRKALEEVSRQQGIRTWVAAASAETDCLGDARIAWKVARAKGLTTDAIVVRPRLHTGGPPVPASPLYSADERRRALGDDLDGLRLPRTLKTFAGLGGRFAGEPVYEPDYHVCSLPLVVEFNGDGKTPGRVRD